MNGAVPPATLLECINPLLTDETAEWAETNPDAARLLADEELTAEIALAFRNLFRERFPARSIDSFTVSFDIELSELKRKPDEPITSCYKHSPHASCWGQGSSDSRLSGAFSFGIRHLGCNHESIRERLI